ncbi:MAG: ABC transporter substrate-binding protein [Alphaproteobacteria bacterium]|nr:ABC transporter substrate-binding protein [Alphaproteobacteria bacterium]
MTSRILAATIVAASVAAATGAGAQALRIGLQSDVDTLDPVQSNNIAARSVFTALCDKLVDIDEKLGFQPQLAQSWSWSADRTTLTMKLRPGVVFHDGSPFDAAAVKANLERALNLPGSRRRSEISAIAEIVPVDATTAEIRLSAPSAPLLSQLADRAGMMLSPAAFASAATRPVCSGPFELVERVAQDRIVLKRFERYWDRARVALEQVVFRPMPDTTVRLLNLRSGAIDLAERVAASDAAAVAADAKLRLVEITGLGFTSIIVNVGNGEQAATPLGRDPRVRAALDLAIDRAALNRVVFEGRNEPGNQPVPPSSPYYQASVPLRGADVAAARTLLAQAGQTAPTIKLLTPNTTEFRAMAEVIQAMAGEAGFRLEIDSAELATAAQRMTRGEFQAFLIGWSGRVDPDGNIYAFNHCRGSNNDSKFCDSRVDAALDRARAELDEGARRAAYAEAAAIYLPALHRIYLVHENWRFALSGRVAGFRAIPDGVIRLQGLRLD